MHLSKDLLDRLNCEETALSSRLQLAKNSFLSSDLCLHHKEEIIILWLSKAAVKFKNDYKLLKEVCDSLLEILSSPHFEVLSPTDMKSTAKIEFIRNVKRILKLKTVPEKLFICIFVLCGNNVFLNFFKKNVNDFLAFHVQVLKVLPPSEDNLEKVIKCLTEVHKSVISKKEFTSIFIKEYLEDFLKYYEKCDVKTHDIKMVRLLQIIIFKKIQKKEARDFLDSLFTCKTIMACEPVEELLKVMTVESDNDVLTNMYTLIFRSFTLQFQHDNHLIYQFFVILCHCLGFEQNTKLIINGTTENLLNGEWLTEILKIVPYQRQEDLSALQTLKLLIMHLSESIVDYDVKIKDTSIITWIQSLTKSVVEQDTLTCHHLNIISSVCCFCPVAIEPLIGHIFSNIFKQSDRTHNDDFNEAYGDYLEQLLIVFSRLQRFQKLIVKYLFCLQNQNNSAISVPVLLPNKFCTKVKEIVTTLPSSQALSMFESFLSSLETYCINKLEIEKDKLNITMVQSTCELLCIFLSCCKLLDHSVPKHVFEHFLYGLDKLKSILHKFGSLLLLHPHEPCLMQPFLKLCFHWGEVEILVNCYSNLERNIQHTHVKDISPTNIAVLHSYLDGSQWNAIAERVANFGAEECNNLMLRLILQKLRLSKLTNNILESNTEITAKYLCFHLFSGLYQKVASELSSEEMESFIKSLNIEQISELVQKILEKTLDKSTQHNLILKWFFDPKLQECRHFILGTILAVVRVICNRWEQLIIFDSDEKRVNVYKNTITLFKNELHCNNGQFVIPELTLAQLSELVNESCLQSIKVKTQLSLSCKNDLKFIKVSYELLQKLPLIHLEKKQQTFIFLFSLLNSFITTAAEDGESTKKFEVTNILFDVISKLLENGNFTLCDTNIGYFAKWLLMNFENDKVAFKLMAILTDVSLKNQLNLKQFGKAVSFVKKKCASDWDKYLDIVVLLHKHFSLRKHKKKDQNESNQIMMKYRKKMSKGIMLILETETPSVNSCDLLLQAYTCELHRALAVNNNDLIKNILNLNFQQYYEVGLQGLESGNKYCLAFVEVVLCYYTRLRPHLKENIIHALWNHLKTSELLTQQHIIHLCKHSTFEEFEGFLTDLLCLTKVTLNSSDVSNQSSRCLYILQNFLMCEVSTEKLVQCQKVLQCIYSELISYSLRVPELKTSEMLSFYDFFSFCILNKKITITSEMMDTFMQYTTNSPLEKVLNISEFEQLFSCCVKSISSLLLSRTVFIVDRIQSVFQCFEKLLYVLVKQSDVSLKLSDEQLSHLSSCAFLFEKMTSHMVKIKRDFSRISSYFIAEIINSLEKITVYPQIKVHLINCINNFLSISDFRNITFLLRVLSLPSQQVFKNIHQQFKKYYQFTGKV